MFLQNNRTNATAAELGLLNVQPNALVSNEADAMANQVNVSLLKIYKVWSTLPYNTLASIKFSARRN